MNNLFSIFILFQTVTALAQQVYTNEVFDDNIRSVQMDNIVHIGGAPTLEFDYLGGGGPYMRAKIIHCNWDWKQSILMDNEFMNDFNEFQVNDVEGSASAYIPYYHYRFVLPTMKLSGNYILKIYDDDKPEITYMYRRFSVYEDRILVSGSKTISNVVQHRFTHQQIDFQFGYANYDIQDPYQNLHAVVRQNYRWDNAKTKLRPSYINEADKVLKFNFYGGESTFNGGVEYRQIYFGRRMFNIDHFEKTNNGTHYYLRQDVNRSHLNYTDQQDNNGYYLADSPYDADYSIVHFSLRSGNVGDVYIFGQLSDWKLDARFKLDFDSVTEVYSKEILLKNGEYDFSYAIDNQDFIDETSLQGSHSETRNDYDILIYYRPFGKAYDRLIGYKRID